MGPRHPGGCGCRRAHLDRRVVPQLPRQRTQQRAAPAARVAQQQRQPARLEHAAHAVQHRHQAGARRGDGRERLPPEGGLWAGREGGRQVGGGPSPPPSGRRQGDAAVAMQADSRRQPPSHQQLRERRGQAAAVAAAHHHLPALHCQVPKPDLHRGSRQAGPAHNFGGRCQSLRGFSEKNSSQGMFARHQPPGWAFFEKKQQKRPSAVHKFCVFFDTSLPKEVLRVFWPFANITARKNLATVQYSRIHARPDSGQEPKPLVLLLRQGGWAGRLSGAERAGARPAGSAAWLQARPRPAARRTPAYILRISVDLVDLDRLACSEDD